MPEPEYILNNRRAPNVRNSVLIDIQFKPNRKPRETFKSGQEVHRVLAKDAYPLIEENRRKVSLSRLIVRGWNETPELVALLEEQKARSARILEHAKTNGRTIKL